MSRTGSGAHGRPRPSREQSAEGYLTVGVIDDAIEEGPGADVQGPDMLIISAEAPGGGTLHRRVTCPLPRSGRGRDLIGQVVAFRHSTLDPDYADDVLVVRWPGQVDRALEPHVPGTRSERAWLFLTGCFAAVGVAATLSTIVMFIGVVFTGGELFAGLPSWFHPGVVLAASAVAAVLGVVAVGLCSRRAAAIRSDAA